jgi:hypothetical protein
MDRRLAIADTVRFNFRAIEDLSIFESSSARSCASSAGKLVGAVRCPIWLEKAEKAVVDSFSAPRGGVSAETSQNAPAAVSESSRASTAA